MKAVFGCRFEVSAVAAAVAAVPTASVLLFCVGAARVANSINNKIKQILISEN